MSRLREELGRVAEAAPVADVPADTWARATRSRRRVRAAAVVAWVAGVALLGGLVVWLPEGGSPPVAERTAGPGVPDRIHAVPARLAERGGDDESWTSDRVESDVAVGRAAAAYVMEEGLPVVVGAEDGAYHLLDLPGFVGNDFWTTVAATAPGLALSPDGRQLAYAWATIGPEAARRRVPSGIRVLDLETGDVREVPVPGGEGVLVTWIDWSPAGEWLVWRGDQMASWTQFEMGGKTEVGGRIAPGATTSEPLPVPRGNALLSWAVGDDGRVVVVGDSRMLDLPPGATEPSRVPLRVGGSFSKDAELRGEDVLDVRVGLENGRYTVFRHGGDTTRTPLHPEVAGGDLVPLGWVDEEHLLARASSGGDLTGGRAGPSDLVLLGVGDRPSYAVVGAVDAGVPALSVATDLVTRERPTVERPEPDWPWSITRWGLVVGGSVLGLVLLGAVVLRRRRPRR
ncbi:hypothetical protein [Nocardioides dongkuii]|uniref:hypothetical protein n=1 Tax=Nocardioides dongkuii TaxID=2760089 RepID=UPI0015F8E469|nr:hypothetical protein [Nocardioides dongkuii]